LIFCCSNHLCFWQTPGCSSRYAVQSRVGLFFPDHIQRFSGETLRNFWALSSASASIFPERSFFTCREPGRSFCRAVPERGEYENTWIRANPASLQNSSFPQTPCPSRRETTITSVVIATRELLSYQLHRLPVFVRGIAPVHSFQDSCTAALQREMEVRHSLLSFHSLISAAKFPAAAAKITSLREF